MTALTYTGNIIFVRPGDQDWEGQLVARMTHGPYCHVRIQIRDGEVIEAVAGYGVVESNLGNPDPADVADIAITLEYARREHAFKWLQNQLGRGYSYLDIAADALKLILPKWLGSETPFLVRPSRYDCSSLATLFLLAAGYQWLPDELVSDPFRASPNDLARALGVLKS